MGQFKILKSKDGKFYFTLSASNNEVIATSEMYEAKQSAYIGIKSLKVNAMKSEILDLSAGVLTAKDELSAKDALKDNAGFEAIEFSSTGTVNNPEAVITDVTSKPTITTNTAPAKDSASNNWTGSKPKPKKKAVKTVKPKKK